MPDTEVETKLRTITDSLVNELISLTPESMAEIEFEIVATSDGGADIGLLENHPDVTRVKLSPMVYDLASRYLPLIKRYIQGWKRSLIVMRQAENGWDVSMKFERQ